MIRARLFKGFWNQTGIIGMLSKSVKYSQRPTYTSSTMRTRTLLDGVPFAKALGLSKASLSSVQRIMWMWHGTDLPTVHTPFVGFWLIFESINEFWIDCRRPVNPEDPQDRIRHERLHTFLTLCSNSNQYETRLIEMTTEEHFGDSPEFFEYNRTFPKVLSYDLDHILQAQPKVCLNFLDIPLSVSSLDSSGVEYVQNQSSAAS